MSTTFDQSRRSCSRSDSCRSFRIRSILGVRRRSNAAPMMEAIPSKIDAAPASIEDILLFMDGSLRSFDHRRH